MSNQTTKQESRRQDWLEAEIEAAFWASEHTEAFNVFADGYREGYRAAAESREEPELLRACKALLSSEVPVNEAMKMIRHAVEARKGKAVKP